MLNLIVWFFLGSWILTALAVSFGWLWLAARPARGLT